MKKISYLFIVVVLCIGCTSPKQSITFDTIIIDEKFLLLPDETDTVPYGEMDIEFTYPKELATNKDKLEKLQKLFQRYCLGEDYENFSRQEAFEKLKKDYTEDYRAEMTEYYLEDRETKTREELFFYSYSYDLDKKDSIVFYNNAFISFSNFEYFYSGGSHGMHGTWLYSIDLNSLERIGVDDVFKPETSDELIDVISDKLQQIFTEFDVDDPTLYLNELTVTDNFYITETGVQFTYNPYEIAPYAVGELDVVITYDEIKDLLLPDFKQKYSLN